VDALADLPEGTVVDGELVAIDESGRPDFNLLQNFRAEASRIHYYIFDLLCCEGRDLTHRIDAPSGLFASPRGPVGLDQQPQILLLVIADRQRTNLAMAHRSIRDFCASFTS